MKDFDLKQLETFPKHRDVLKNTIDYFAADNRVLGLFVGGSIVSGTMDEYSDIDVDVIVRDDDFESVFSERGRAVEAIGRPLARFIADHLPIRVDMFIVLYEGPVKLDLDYIRASVLEPNWRWSRRHILKDTDGFLADIVSRSEGMTRPSLDVERIQNLDEKFWTWCWYVFGKIQRGELWEALDGIHGIRTLAILPFFYSAEDLYNEGYRRLEGKIPPDLLESFEDTIPQMTETSLHAALQSLISLYLELRGRISEARGIGFDSRKQTYVLNEMKKRWEGKREKGLK
jgi:hypothetical protein